MLIELLSVLFSCSRTVRYVTLLLYSALQVGYALVPEAFPAQFPVTCAKNLYRQINDKPV